MYGGQKEAHRAGIREGERNVGTRLSAVPDISAN